MSKRSQEEMAHDAFVSSADEESSPKSDTFASHKSPRVDLGGTCRYESPTKIRPPPLSPSSTAASTPTIVPTSPQMRARAQTSNYAGLPVRELKARLAAVGVDIMGITEKTELVMMLERAENPQMFEDFEI